MYAMLKRIIDAFYDIVDYGLFSSVRKKNIDRTPQPVPEASEKAVQPNKGGEPPSESFFVRYIIDIIGAALAVHLENREYACRVIIKVLFKIFIWICIMAGLSVWLEHIQYYDFNFFY